MRRQHEEHMHRVQLDGRPSFEHSWPRSGFDVRTGAFDSEPCVPVVQAVSGDASLHA